MIYFSFQMTEHIYTLPLLLKDIFTDYKILDCQFFFNTLLFDCCWLTWFPTDFCNLFYLLSFVCNLSFFSTEYFYNFLFINDFKEFGYDVSWYNFLRNSYTLGFFNFYTHGIIIFIKFEKCSVLFSTLFFLSFSHLCLLWLP